ncbi:hypothetical protein FRC08_000341 [Ceratobasidium sp. 394]|nr:hypothetical protein FRC08_000341 [Ceratobasidium sp. 394]KAG9087522.1 hypothetical protein FS749_002858 [Ceratobasidium sp. UAMH 11750]
MGTVGYTAVRYKNKYYRQRRNADGYPEGLGREFAWQIPRSAAKMEAWIAYMKEEQLRRHKELADGPEDDGDLCSPEVVEDTAWITGQRDCVHWSYIIDLDYRAFSVRGKVHFKLDNMPRHPSFYRYFDECTEIVHPIPEEYLTTVSYWPDPTFNVQEALDAYNQLAPLTVDLEAWGAPTWDSLTVSQHLSVELVKKIVSDYKKTLAIADLMSEFGKVLLICWQVACAAAPSHVLCPAEITPLSEEARLAVLGRTEWSERPSVAPCQIGVSIFRLSRPYCWFRGCLVKFCLRLDEDVWFKFEVIQMVKQLRKNGRDSGMGILISSLQLVAVAIDGSEIRCSPVMEFHNAKGDVRDGLLLLVHLLGSAATVNKCPWKNAPPLQCNTSSILPEEVIQHVLRFTDDDMYHFVLPLVSRLVRSLCLARPRVGNFVLTRVNSDGTYQVLSTRESGAEACARLVRTNKRVDPDFLGVFQHHQVGIGGRSDVFEKWIEERRKRDPWAASDFSWGTLIRGKGMPMMRVPVVGGVWDMVGVDEVAEAV